MNIQVSLYDSVKTRLDHIQYLLASLANQGIDVTVLHPSITSARKLEQALGMPVLSGYTFAFTPVETGSILVVDGDLLTEKDLKRMESLGKDLYLLVPPGVLPPVGPGNILRDILKSTGEFFPVMTFDDGELPRTYGCHHMADSCSLCEFSVLEWKAARRDS